MGKTFRQYEDTSMKRMKKSKKRNDNHIIQDQLDAMESDAEEQYIEDIESKQYYTVDDDDDDVEYI